MTAGILLLAAMLGGSPEYARSALALARKPDHLILRDLDGDGRKDVIAVLPGGLEIWRQRPQGRFGFASPDQRISFGVRSAGFDVADLEPDGRFEIVVIEEGARIVAWRLDPRNRFARDPQELVSGVAAVLPDGVHRLPFVKDVDGDGDCDLVVPASSGFLVFLQEVRASDSGASERAFAAGPAVAAEIHSAIESGSGESLEGRIGQSIRVPPLSIRDVNGDSRPDLISETSDSVAYYLGGPDGFSAKPSFTLDLAALRREIASKEESVNLSNLAEALSRTVEHRSADVDGDGIEDHVVRQGQKISLFRGRRTGADFARPDQVLKASGNVLTQWLMDSDGDGRLDLCLLRMEDVSAARLLLWLVKSGTLTLEAFVYRNEGSGSFSRRPARRVVIDVQIPALLGFIDRLEEIEKTIAERTRLPASAADLDGDRKRNDGLLLRDGRLHGFLDAVPAEHGGEITAQDYWQTFLKRIGYSADRDHYRIALDEIDRWIPVPGLDLAALLAEAPPSFSLSLGSGTAGLPVGWFFTSDLDGDGREDLILLASQREDGEGGSGFAAEFLIRR
jgi:hypothetical protein